MQVPNRLKNGSVTYRRMTRKHLLQLCLQPGLEWRETNSAAVYEHNFDDDQSVGIDDDGNGHVNDDNVVRGRTPNLWTFVRTSSRLAY